MSGILTRRPLVRRLRLALPWAALLSFCTVLLPLVTTSPAHAALSCSFAIGTVDLGQVGTLSSTSVDGTGTLSIACTGGSAGSTVTICPNIGLGTENLLGGHRVAVSGTNTLLFDLYQDASRSAVWGSAWVGGSGTPPVLTATLDSSGKATITQAIYARAFVSAATPVGLFQANLSLGASTFVYGTGAISCSGLTLGGISVTPTIAFSVQVTATCSVSAQDIDFGTASNLVAAVNATGALQIACNMGTPFTAALDNGGTGTSAIDRRMVLGNSSIVYGLYKDAARSQPWGTPGGTQLTGTGTGSTQTIAVYGRVPAQGTPLSGVYSDRIVVTLSY